MIVAGAQSAGTKGFLFCDLRGYTAFIERSGDQAAAELLAIYRELVRAVIAAPRGSRDPDRGRQRLRRLPGGLGCGRGRPGDRGRSDGAKYQGAPDRGRGRGPCRGDGGHDRGPRRRRGQHRRKGLCQGPGRRGPGHRHRESPDPDVPALSLHLASGPRASRASPGGSRSTGSRPSRPAVGPGSAVSSGPAGAGSSWSAESSSSSSSPLAGAWALNRPADCLSLPADTKDVVARIDPARNCVVAVYDVGRHPSAIAWTADAAWVGNVDDHSISRVEVAVYEVGQEPGPIVVADDRIWVANVKDQTVQWIEPASGRTHTTSARGLITEMVAAEDGIWTLDGHAGRLSKVPFAPSKPFDGLILPTTPPDTSLARTGGSFGGTEGLYNARYGDLVAGGGRLYVTSPKEGVVLRIDPRHEDVTNARSTRWSASRSFSRRSRAKTPTGRSAGPGRGSGHWVSATARSGSRTSVSRSSGGAKPAARGSAPSRPQRPPARSTFCPRSERSGHRARTGR